jgi:hypothetical protein
MHATLLTLTAHVARATRRASGHYLPSSPLTGLGRAGELAAQHPAFAPTPNAQHRSA